MLFQFLISLGLGVAGFFLSFKYLDFSTLQYKEIAAVMAGIGGTLFGFLITSLSILTAVLERKLMINLRKTGHYQVLVKELFLASIYFLFVLVVSLICLFLKTPLLTYSVSLSVGTFIAAIASLAVASYHLFKVMTHLK